MTTSDVREPAIESVALPRTERTDAPAYLQKYLDREGRGGKPHEVADRAPVEGDDGASVPMYLRRFRDRKSGATALEAPVPEWEGRDLGVTQAKALITKSKEIVPEDEPAMGPRTVTQVHIIRHGETQGYSTESGLTPLGSWQAHRRGFDISKGIREGERVRIVCADTNRARQTAEQIRKGLLDGMTMWNRTAEISEVDGMEEFRNFQVWTPEGLRDVTGAFRLYQKEMEKYERVALGDRPLWLVEVDRFWRTQQGGGDPITYWTQIPMLQLRAAVGDGAALLGRHPADQGRDARRPHHRGHPLRPHPRLRHGRPRLRPGRALQHRGGHREAARGRLGGLPRLPQPRVRGPGASARRPARLVGGPVRPRPADITS